jgi:oleate hydratase
MRNEERKVHLVGAGIANMAVAFYLIKDGGFSGANIKMYEQDYVPGGCLDARGDAEKGYNMQGERMFEEHYVCFYDMMSYIPSLEDPNKSVKEDTLAYWRTFPWNNKCRLVEKGKKIDADHYGLTPQHTMEMMALNTKPEKAFNDKRISDVFSESFFDTNFWHMWKTLFAFEPWHSAIELRRYFLRFMHLMPDQRVMSMIHRTRYNNYDSVVRPTMKWLTDRGVSVAFKTVVTDLDIGGPADKDITVRSITMVQDGKEKKVEIRPQDIVIATLGSMVSNSVLGNNDSPAPPPNVTKLSGSWALWQTLSKKRKDVFCDPSTFTDHVDESTFISYTVTQNDPLFFKLMEELSEQVPGRNGITTLPHSPWCLTFILNTQPYYAEQAKDTLVWYGISLYPEKTGEFVKKPMTECSGREILEEMIGHLAFDVHKKQILDSSIVIPNRMPFITSQFLVRNTESRPPVIPEGSTNLGLIGQYVEIPDDCVFTVEYSVRGAQTAAFKLGNINKEPTPFQHVSRDLGVVFAAAKALQQ